LMLKDLATFSIVSVRGLDLQLGHRIFLAIRTNDFA